MVIISENRVFILFLDAGVILKKYIFGHEDLLQELTTIKSNLKQL